MKRLAHPLLLAAAVLCSAALQAAPIGLVSHLTGAQENPPSGSPGIGKAHLILDDEANTMRLFVVFSGLIGTTTLAHIHCCVDPPGNAGVATQLPSFVGFPVGVSAGSYDHTFDMSLASSFNPTFLAAAGGSTEVAADTLFAALLAGRAYLNIHSTTNPGGEIRGFFTVPEPSTLLLLGIAALAGAAMRRRSS